MQDFPVTAAPGAPPTDLPHRHKDPQPFRLTLRCFIKELIRQRFPSEDERPDLLASLGVFVRLLKDVDFSGAKGTLIASLPKRGLSYHPCTNWDGPVQFNAVRGLSKALGRYLWPEAARGTPINYLTGALGNMANRPWLESLVHGAMAGGGHGPAVDAAGELRLRVVWPTNDTAFRAVHSDEAELATRSLAHNWRYGEDGQVRSTLCIRSHSGVGRSLSCCGAPSDPIHLPPSPHHTGLPLPALLRRGAQVRSQPRAALARGRAVPCGALEFPPAGRRQRDPGLGRGGLRQPRQVRGESTTGRSSTTRIHFLKS